MKLNKRKQRKNEENKSKNQKFSFSTSHIYTHGGSLRYLRPNVITNILLHPDGNFFSFFFSF